MMPAASIVVLTYNRKDALGDCLAAIVAKTGGQYELLVVDNGSTDGTLEWLADDPWYGCVPFRTFPLGENQGVCARNHALRDAQGQFILQVDDDVVVGPGWDKCLLAPFEDPKVGAVGQEGFWLNWAGLMAGPWKAPNFLDDRRPQPGDLCDLVMGFCFAFRNERLADESPRFVYDEQMAKHWHEETDLQLQIKAAGYRIRCIPPVATHRSLKDWQRAHSNDPDIGLHLAAQNERYLIEKWQHRRSDLGLELDRRGLQ